MAKESLHYSENHMADQISKIHYGTVTLQDTANKERPSSETDVVNSVSPDAQNREIGLPVHITDLPAEIFQHILRYLTFDNISKLRLVSRYFNDMCSSLLNSEFNRLRVLVQQRFMAIKAQMPRRESSRRKHPLARESDIIETLYMRLTLLNMTFGKHIERKYCCFFAGEIIDEVYKILRYVQNTPSESRADKVTDDSLGMEYFKERIDPSQPQIIDEIYKILRYVQNTPSLSRAYKVTDELFDLSTMAMEYFKEHIEPTLPEVTYFASDVFEYPSFSSVKAQHSMIEETMAVSSDSSYQSANCPLQNINKRLKQIGKKVNRNSKEIANLKRSVKDMSQKVNSLGAIVSQLKKEDNCDTTILPLKLNDSHKINKILGQLNTCKEEIEDLTSKLSVCSDKESNIDFESLWESSVSIRNFNSGSSRATTSSISSSCILNAKMYPSEATISREFYMFSPSPLLSTLRNTFKRKAPSSTVSSMLEWSEPKRKRTVGEETDSASQEE